MPPDVPFPKSLPVLDPNRLPPNAPLSADLPKRLFPGLVFDVSFLAPVRFCPNRLPCGIEFELLEPEDGRPGTPVLGEEEVVLNSPDDGVFDVSLLGEDPKSPPFGAPSGTAASEAVGFGLDGPGTGG